MQLGPGSTPKSQSKIPLTCGRLASAAKCPKSVSFFDVFLRMSLGASCCRDSQSRGLMDGLLFIRAPSAVARHDGKPARGKASIAMHDLK